MININNCEIGHLYIVNARNYGHLGIYVGNGMFKVLASDYCKYVEYVEIEYHFQIGTVKPLLKNFGTCEPIEDLGIVLFDVDVNDNNEILKYLLTKEVDYARL